MPHDLAERLDKARAEAHERWKRGEPEPKTDWSKYEPIVIPPGKENTPRGRQAARLNAMRERLKRFDEEEKRQRALGKPAP